MENQRKPTNTVGAYAVQCGECFKWRFIPTQEEYEDVRRTFIEDPWVCHRSPNLSCDDPGDVQYDTANIWVIDKPNLPKTPSGVKRRLTLRSDYSKLDVIYVMPNGKKVRSSVEIVKFLEAFPEYKDKFSATEFSFTSPKIPPEMIPKDLAEKVSQARRKKQKTENYNP